MALSELTIDFAAAGDNVVVPCSEGEQILVKRIWFTIEAATTIRWRDGEGGDWLTGPIVRNAGAAFLLEGDENTYPWFTTSGGKALVINLSSGVQVSGRVYFKRQRA